MKPDPMRSTLSGAQIERNWWVNQLQQLSAIYQTETDCKTPFAMAVDVALRSVAKDLDDIVKVRTK